MGVVAQVENDLYWNECRTAHVNTATTRNAYVSQKFSLIKRFIKIRKNYLYEWELKYLPWDRLAPAQYLRQSRNRSISLEILQEICFAKPTSFLMSILLISQSTIPPTCTEVNHIAQTPAENQWHWTKVKSSLIVTIMVKWQCLLTKSTINECKLFFLQRVKTWGSKIPGQIIWDKNKFAENIVSILHLYGLVTRSAESAMLFGGFFITIAKLSCVIGYRKSTASNLSAVTANGPTPMSISFR